MSDNGEHEETIQRSKQKSDVLHIYNTPAHWDMETINRAILDLTKTHKILTSIEYLVMLKEDNEKGSFLNTGEFLVKFKNPYTCKQAYTHWTLPTQKKLFNMKYDKDNLYKKKICFRKPFVFNLRNKPSFDEPMAKRQKFYKRTPVNDNSMINETYGLSMEYLNNLNIKLPLGNKVFVSNLYPEVDEAKLREVFGLAGQIVHLLLVKKIFYDPIKCFAKIEYDHPVEAVQAISMFNNQILFEQVLRVQMNTKPANNLPNGLIDIGPGLGPNGEPLRGVRNYIELQPIQQFINSMRGEPKGDYANKKAQNLSPFVKSASSMFAPMASNSSLCLQMPMVGQTSMAPAGLQSIMPIPVSNPNQQAMNVFGSTPAMMNPFSMPTMQGLQLLQNLNQQNPAGFQQAISTNLQSNVNPNVTNQNPDVSGNTSSEWQGKSTTSNQTANTHPYSSEMENKNKFGYYRGSDNSQKNNSGFNKYDKKDSKESKKSSRDDDKSNIDKSDMLLFKNLPRSVSLQALKNKMLEVGDLKFAEITGQGRAIVRFVHANDAERCINLFDRSKVDGQIIDVRYF